MIKPAKLLLPLAIVLFAPSLSRADLSITLGNNPQPGEENVLLNTGTTGNTVLGTLNQSGFLVNFASTQVLTEPSNGQARIEATNNSSQVPVTDISFSLANGTFTDAIFNPFIGGPLARPVTPRSRLLARTLWPILRHLPEHSASEMARIS